MHGIELSVPTQPHAVEGAQRCGERRRTVVEEVDRLAAAVRKAEALIVARPDAAFTADGLARAVGVSARSLSRGFQRLRGQSPMAAVRRARLERVRLDLISAPSGESVTDAAMRWGFFHLGRFSSVYATHFGELPSETRRRARPSPRPTAN